MKRNVALAVALLCAFSFAAFAQHDHGEKKPAIDPAAMDAMIKAGTPGDAHKKLDVFVGTWDTKVTFWMAPGGEPMSSSGTSVNTLTMGGRFLEQRFKGQFGEMPFEGLGFTGYDNVKKQYWGTWIDSTSTAIMMTTGSSSDGKTFTFTGMMPDPSKGTDVPVEEKIVIVDADHHTFEMWSPGPDGKPFKSMEIAYTRKK